MLLLVYWIVLRSLLDFYRSIARDSAGSRTYNDSRHRLDFYKPDNASYLSGKSLIKI